MASTAIRFLVLGIFFVFGINAITTQAYGSNSDFIAFLMVAIGTLYYLRTKGSHEG